MLRSLAHFALLFLLASFSAPAGHADDRGLARIRAEWADVKDAFSGIALKWSSTACGELINSGVVEEIRKLKVNFHPYEKPKGRTAGMVDSKGRPSDLTSQFSPTDKTLDLTFDDGMLRKAMGLEPHKHLYAGMLARRVVGAAKGTGAPDHAAGDCVMSYLQERDALRNAAPSQSSHAPESAPGSGKAN